MPAGNCHSPTLASRTIGLTVLALLGAGLAIRLAADAPKDRKQARSGCAPAPTSRDVTNVRDLPFAPAGDGVTDDTAALQKAINTVAGSGGTLFIPDGTYLINPNAVDGRKGLILGNRMTLRLAPRAVLKAMPSASTGYAILEVAAVSDVNIIGGTLLGERDNHKGIGGEWGMGLDINNARNVTVEDVTARDCWGDGFYVGISSKNVTLCRVTADHNRRQGFSITGVDGLVVRDSIFKNTEGTPGETGLDIEPNNGQTVCNVLITGSTFTHNGGGGLSSGVPGAHTGSAFVYNIIIDNNSVTDNGLHNTPRTYANALEISNSIATKITNNTLRGNRGRGILLRSRADQTLCTGNKILGTIGFPGDALLEDTCSGNTITGNTINGNLGHGILSAGCRNSVIRDNTLSANGKDH